MERRLRSQREYVEMSPPSAYENHHLPALPLHSRVFSHHSRLGRSTLQTHKTPLGRW